MLAGEGLEICILAGLDADKPGFADIAVMNQRLVKQSLVHCVSCAQVRLRVAER